MADFRTKAKYKMNVEHLFLCQKVRKDSENDWVQKDIRGSHWPNMRQSEYQNK